MMISSRVFAAFALLGALGLAPARAAAPAIPPAAKEANDVSPYRRAIEEFIKDRVAKLADPAAQVKAREELCYESLIRGESRGSLAYLDFYAETLSKYELTLTSNPAMRVRLNGAIVATRVAVRTGSTRLTGAASAFLDDNSSAVVLWGVKCTGVMLPTLLNDPNVASTVGMPLLEKLTAAVIRHNRAPLFDEAYEVLAMNVTRDRRAVSREALAIVVPYIQKLMESRVAQYVKAVPDDPAAESNAIRVLCDDAVWSANPATQTRTVQVFVNLLSLAAQRNAAAQQQDRVAFVDVTRLSASALSVVGERTKSQAIMDTVSPLSKISTRTPPAQVLSLAATAEQVVRGTPQFKDLQAPPTIQSPPAPAPAPAPQPDSPQ